MAGSPCRCTRPSTSTWSPSRSTGCTGTCPILRDPDGYTYIKEEVGGLVVGGFEPDAKPWVSPDALPYPFEFQLLDEDWDHFAILMDSACTRIPVLAETGIKMFYNGPESFTPDNQFILGEAPELRNFFVARRLQLGRHRVRGRRRARAGRMDLGGEPEPGPVRRSTSAGSPRSTGTTSGCTTGSARSWACTTPCRGRTASWTRARPFRRSPAYHLLERGQRRLRQQDGLGAGELLRPARPATRTSSTAGASRTGSPGPRPSSAPPAPASPCSTRPRSPSTW